jgi:GGDEF domain-containing protein
MEYRSITVKNIFAILLAAFALPSMVYAEEQRIAIVASAGSGFKAISAKEVRRAYLSLYPGDGSYADSLLKNADTAMYQAKAAGGNTYRFHTANILSI